MKSSSDKLSTTNAVTAIGVEVSGFAVQAVTATVLHWMRMGTRIAEQRNSSLAAKGKRTASLTVALTKSSSAWEADIH